MAVDWQRVGTQYDRWVEHARQKLADAETTSPTLMWILVGVIVVGTAVTVLLKKATGEPT